MTTTETLPTAPYTPAAEQVRELYAMGAQAKLSGVTFGRGLAEFDSWLAAYTADVQAKALREAADDYQDAATHTTPADIDPGWLRDRADALAPTDDEGGQ